MLKTRIYHLVEKGEHGNKINKIFDYFIMSLIVLNLFSIILGSIPEFELKDSIYLKYFEIFSVIIFTIEYLFRVYVSDLIYPSKNRMISFFRFAFSFFGLIDLFAILPFYLPFFISIDLRAIRVFRLMRFFRIFKLSRYNSAFTTIKEVFVEKKSELLITGFMGLLLFFVSSVIIYEFEYEAQPEKFRSIFDSFWWSITTITTVGYGDIYPVTVVGKIFTGVIMITGIFLLALPTGIISSGFINRLSRKDGKINYCPHCGKKLP